MNNTTNSWEEVKNGLKEALRWPDFDTFATDGDSKSSLDRAVDYVCTLLHDTEIAAHKTEDGYCCACDYDTARMNEQIEQARKETREEIKADCIGIVGEFILDPDCGQNPEYAADQCTPTCGQNFAAKEIKKRLLALREKVDKRK